MSINLFKRYKTEKREAKRILDGVIAISEAEQLIHGEYITSVVKPALTHNICGGRQACLIGSVALAAAPGAQFRTVNKIIDAIRYDETVGHRYQAYSRAFLPASRFTKRNYPAALRAMDALNQEAAQRLKGKRSEAAREARNSGDHNIAESYFETYLFGKSQPKTHEAIVSLCEAAKARV